MGMRERGERAFGILVTSFSSYVSIFCLMMAWLVLEVTKFGGDEEA